MKEELKRVVEMKKVLEHSNSENQITLTKLDSVEMRLQQMTDRYESLTHENKELVERVNTDSYINISKEHNVVLMSI